MIIGTVLILCAVSLLELWSIDTGNKTRLLTPDGVAVGGQASNFFIKQALFIGVGLAAMFLFSFLDCRIFRNYSSLLILLYVILLVTLAAVLFFGHRIRGTIAWFKIGEINFAPVELAKLVIILILAKYFSARHAEVYRVRHIIASAIYTLLPAVLVLAQPDLGSTLILGAVWFGIVLLSGIKQRHLLLVVLAGILIISLAWLFVFKNYQKERILTIFNPAKDPLGYSYNLIQSKIAIGSGGLWGKGLGHGSQGQLNFLPEKHNDFIFALYAEEWGFLGVAFLFVVYLLFFHRLIKLILLSTNNFFRLFIAGFAVVIFSHIAVNVGMNLGLLPITGIPLPFLSYGGSNLLINFVALGIIQNIAVQIKEGVILTKEG